MQKARCSPPKSLKAKARVNMVNIVRKYFARRARQLPISQPSDAIASSNPEDRFGISQKIVGLTLGYPKNLFWDYTTKYRDSLGDIPGQIARCWDYAFSNIFLKAHWFIVRNHLAFQTADA
jgi:hypothetical protein